MSSIFSGTLTKIIAQVTALVMVVGGLAAFVITQANADKTVTADAENVEQPTEDKPLDIERVSSITPLSATQLEIPQLMEVTVGTDSKEILTTGDTVQEVLDNAGVSVGSDDKVSPKVDQNVNSDTSINVTVVEKSDVVEEETVEYETTYENDGTLEKGKTKTDTEGVNGVASVTYQVTTENGEEVDKTETNREITEEPTNAVVLRGTKEPEPEPEPEPSTSSESSSDSSSSSSSSGGNTGTSAPSVANGSTWDAMAQCESGGNWSANTGNGYYGGLQFLPSTWQAAGGTQYAALPHQASREQQIAVANSWLSRTSWSQWPACSASLGLR